MIKVYRTISSYPIVKISSGTPGQDVRVSGKLSTDDEDVQRRIESSASFKKYHWIYVDEKMTEAANDGVSDSDISEVIDGADPDDVVHPEKGKVYAMNDLLKMKVPELRGILGKMNVSYSGLNKQQLISSILNGKRMD